MTGGGVIVGCMECVMVASVPYTIVYRENGGRYVAIVDETEPINIEDANQLTRYLRRTARISSHDNVRVTPLVGGVSNRTIKVSLPDGTRWVLKQALPKLLVEVDWFSDVKRVHQEALALQWIERLTSAGSTPTFLFEDQTHHLLAMEYVPTPHFVWKDALLRGEVDDGLVRQFGTILGSLHGAATDHRVHLAKQFGDWSGFESLRIEPYYEFAASAVPLVGEFLRGLATDLRTGSKWTLVHGDYSPKNILVHAERLIVIDHEVAHWGDGAFDVGFSLTHMLAKALHIEKARNRFVEAAHLHWQSYVTALANRGDRDLERRAVLHTLGCLVARVAGRSPLEYLTVEDRAKQLRTSIDLIASVPSSIPELIDRYAQELG